MRIVHHIPGRLRVRVPPPADGESLAEALQKVPGVRSAAWSPRARSVLVLYEAAPGAAPAILEALGEHGPVDEPAAVAAPPPHDTRVPVARAVSDAFADLDAGVRRASRGYLALGAVVPLALTLWAVRELALGRTAPLAWSSALWYAHGLFRDYNSPPSP
jgi:hypothetical protein